MAERKLDREREIMAARKSGATLEAIAATHGITRERVRQIVRRATPFVRKRRVPIMTSREFEAMTFQPVEWILVCGVCDRPIHGDYFDAPELKRYGRCHKSCYLRKLTPEQRKEYQRAQRSMRRAGVLL